MKFENHSITKYQILALERAKPKGYTTKELIKRLGISKSTYYRIRKGGKPSLNTAKHISRKIFEMPEREQLLTAKVVKHLKRYGRMSDKKFNEYKKKIFDKTDVVIKILDLEDEEYLFFRALYGRSVNNELFW